MTILDKVQDAAKAFVSAAVAALIVVIEGTLSDPNGGLTNVDLPNTAEEFAGLGFAVVLGFVLPYLKRNFPSVEKAEKTLALAQERVNTGKQSV